MSPNPLHELTKALDKQVEDDRAAPKKVRHCPSCGSRRLKASSLHYYCHHCQYEFLIAPLTKVGKVRLSKEGPAVCSFDVICTLDAPRARQGVEEMLKDDNISRPTTRLGSLDFDD